MWRFVLAAPPKRYTDTEEEVDLSTTVSLTRVLIIFFRIFVYLFFLFKPLEIVTLMHRKKHEMPLSADAKAAYKKFANELSEDERENYPYDSGRSGLNSKALTKILRYEAVCSLLIYN